MGDRSDWTALLEAAEAMPEAELRIEVEGRVIRRGLHVTEVRRTSTSAIDCGSGRREWEEVGIELLRLGAAPMKGATLAGLLRRSADALGLEPGLPLAVEASPDGRGIRRHRVGVIEADEDGLRIRLEPMHPACRPLGVAGCCGSRVPLACCG